MGDRRVGKTSFMTRFVDDAYVAGDDTRQARIEDALNFKVRRVRCDRRDVTVLVWDLGPDAGKSRFTPDRCFPL